MGVASIAQCVFLFATLAVVHAAPWSTQPSDFVLSPGRAGFVELGATIDEIYDLVGRQRVRLVDLFSEGQFTPAIEIDLPGTNASPSIVARIREYPCRQFAIDGIWVRDPRFQTAEGVGVGSTIGDLRRVYDVRFSREEGHSVIVNSKRMTFEIAGTAFADAVSVTSVWLWPDPSDVTKRRCPGL
jgi:hypothetical protein